MSDDTTAFPAVTSRQIQCSPCGALFAAGTEAVSRVMAESMRPAALGAGWMHAGEQWTCNVCVAKAASPAVAEPAPEPGKPAPDTDPYQQYMDVWAELDASHHAFWAWANPRNDIAGAKTYARIGDGFANVAAILGSSPEEEEVILAAMRDMARKYRLAGAAS
jgi:hypothetical protein